MDTVKKNGWKILLGIGGALVAAGGVLFGLKKRKDALALSEDITIVDPDEFEDADVEETSSAE